MADWLDGGDVIVKPILLEGSLMALYAGPKNEDKRKRRDLIKSAMKIISAVCWILFVLTLGYISRAMPEQPTIFDPQGVRHQARLFWDPDLILNAYISLNATLVASLAGLALNAFRVKRTSDHVNPSLIMMTVLSFVGILIIYFNSD
ncbi:hypothetical protein [Candidatus Magnetomonas plexicatena]|uniref:hypothetical protein n=1 Tax=Candidatus Magnetomonas plexicatena TaxID=2552947 RepID=UPI001100BE61|nr:hypothetical protein E2O03_011755 [Nitrospirales bacterium LBB_01]